MCVKQIDNDSSFTPVLHGAKRKTTESSPKSPNPRKANIYTNLTDEDPMEEDEQCDEDPMKEDEQCSSNTSSNNSNHKASTPPDNQRHSNDDDDENINYFLHMGSSFTSQRKRKSDSRNPQQKSTKNNHSSVNQDETTTSLLEQDQGDNETELNFDEDSDATLIFNTTPSEKKRKANKNIASRKRQTNHHPSSDLTNSSRSPTIVIRNIYRYTIPTVPCNEPRSSTST